MPQSRHEGRSKGKGIGASKLVDISVVDRDLAHLHVLHNTTEVEPFVEEHKNLLRSIHGDRNESLITKQHNKHFIEWFEERICRQLVLDGGSVCEKLCWLSRRPASKAFSYTSYAINGYTFYTKAQDEKSRMQNSGVTVVGEGWHISSAKDTSPIYAEMTYFGVIESILELDYSGFRQPVFRCEWVNNTGGRLIDEFGFISVNLSKVGYKDDPYILPSLVAQVFYIADPSKKNCSIVVQSNKNYVDHVDDESVDIDMNHLFENEASFFTSLLQDFDEPENGFDDESTVYVRSDHREGTWVNRKRKRKRVAVVRFHRVTRIRATRK